jgi:hypothetical protein
VSRAAPETGLGDEGRFELAMAAAAQEKRNRPAALVVVSGVVLAASLVFAVWSITSRSAADADRQKALGDQRAVEQLAKDWQELSKQEREGPGVGGLGEKLANPFSRMETLARDAGLKATPANPQTKTDRPPGIVVTEYSYRGVKDASLPALMEWVRLATTLGMEVTGLTLKNGPTDWTMDVTFRRWERAG